jgi:hypothetical protein
LRTFRFFHYEGFSFPLIKEEQNESRTARAKFTSGTCFQVLTEEPDDMKLLTEKGAFMTRQTRVMEVDEKELGE